MNTKIKGHFGDKDHSLYDTIMKKNTNTSNAVISFKIYNTVGAIASWVP